MMLAGKHALSGVDIGDFTVHLSEARESRSSKLKEAGFSVRLCVMIMLCNAMCTRTQ